MKKTDDYFFAGMVAGAIGGSIHLIYNGVLILLGVIKTSFAQALVGLFYNKQLMGTWFAQAHGVIDAIGISAVNGVLLSLILKVTGRDFLYTKSIALSAAGAYFLFIVVYPQTGLGKDSPIVPWVALFGHVVFNGLIVGYILQKIYSFKQEPRTESGSNMRLKKFHLSPLPARKLKERKVHFIKPKKI